MTISTDAPEAAINSPSSLAMLVMVGAKVASTPIFPVFFPSLANLRASSIMASFGFSTGRPLDAKCARTFSMGVPKAEQVKRTASQPHPSTAYLEPDSIENFWLGISLTKKESQYYSVIVV